MKNIQEKKIEVQNVSYETITCEVTVLQDKKKQKHFGLTGGHLQRNQTQDGCPSGSTRISYLIQYLSSKNRSVSLLRNIRKL